MFITGEVRKTVKTGHYICFIGTPEHYAVSICDLEPSRYRQYLVSKDGYILLVREIPKKLGGYKRYYYKIPREFLKVIGHRGAVTLYKISNMLIYRPDTLYRVEDVAPSGHIETEYQQRSLFSELYHKAVSFISHLFHHTPSQPQHPAQEYQPSYPPQQQQQQQQRQISKATTTTTTKQQKRTPQTSSQSQQTTSKQFPYVYFLIPVLIALIASRK
jgi:hypothetical protein